MGEKGDALQLAIKEKGRLHGHSQAGPEVFTCGILSFGLINYYFAEVMTTCVPLAVARGTHRGILLNL